MAKKEAKANKEKKSEVKVKKHFLKDFKAELKKVIWPTPKQLVNNTSAVIVIVLITAVLVAVFDLAFREANTYGIYKLQSVVDEKFNSEDTDDSETSSEEDSDSESTDESGTETETTESTEESTEIEIVDNTEATNETTVEE